MKLAPPLVLWLPIAAMMAVIGVSNVAVQHAINDWLTWGAFTYPLAFLVTDLTNRAHGPGRARTVAYVGLPFGIGLSILLAVAADIPLWEGVRVALASGFAFICAQLFDIALFHWLRRGIWWRAPLVSSLSASALDTAIFFSAAFALTGLPWVTWGARRLRDQGRNGCLAADPLPAADALDRPVPLRRLARKHAPCRPLTLSESISP